MDSLHGYRSESANCPAGPTPSPESDPGEGYRASVPSRNTRVSRFQARQGLVIQGRTQDFLKGGGVKFVSMYSGQ